jgi:hypothetical protein
VQRLRLFYTFLLFVLPITLLAQLTTYPLEQRKSRAVKSGNSSARMSSHNEVNPVGLPFWDDFSFTNTDTTDHPLDSLWLENSLVLVSSGQAIHPPSFNVATFDGLNEMHEPYSPNPNDILDFGYRDTLVSQPITLTDVVPANRDSVFLSFSYQAGGHGEPPDPVDFLLLEFKNLDGVWEEVVKLRKSDAPDPAVFYDTLIQITDASYFHNDFQFRFISFGRKSGRYDAWHIDYIYLNEHRHENDNAFPDRTLSTPLGPIFGKYYALPIKHFFEQPQIDSTSFYIRNLNNATTTLRHFTTITSIQTYQGHSTINSTKLDSAKAPYGTNGTTFPKELRQGFIKTLPDESDTTLFNPEAQGIELTIKLWLDSGDEPYISDTTDYSLNYEPINFQINDTLSVNYSLGSVYAYDDGIAEYTAGLVDPGNEVAYRFDNVHAGQDSILNGAYVYFPSFAGVTNASSLDFFIMDDDNGKPGNKLYEQSIDFSLTPDNLFTEINFFEGAIVDDVFYIGYREPAAGSVRVGLDMSNDTGDKMYYRLTENGAWLLNDRVTGSLMMRPRFGPGTINTGVEEAKKPVAIYPNPNYGEFYVKGPFEQLRVINITGQPMNTVIEDYGTEKHVRVSATSTGIYIVQYTSGSKLFTEKILISK